MIHKKTILANCQYLEVKLSKLLDSRHRSTLIKNIPPNPDLIVTNFLKKRKQTIFLNLDFNFVNTKFEKKKGMIG